MVGWQFGVWLLCQRPLLLSTGQSQVPVPCAPLGAAQEYEILEGRTGRCEAGVSSTALVQCARGSELSVSTHQHH